MLRIPYLDANTPDQSRERIESMGDKVLEFRNVFAGYGKKTVLHNIHADFYAGEIASIIGPSGCGKTTFIKIPGRLSEEDEALEKSPRRKPKNGEYWQRGNVNFSHHPEDPNRGTYDLGANGFEEFGGARKIRRNIITMPQGDHPLSNLTVEQNIIMPDSTTREYSEIRTETLKRLGEAIQNASLNEVFFQTEEQRKAFMENGTTSGTRLKDYPGSFSGGQQQRISLATRFMMGGKRLIFDEGLSALDPKIQREIMSLLGELINSKIIDLVMVVCHSLNIVKSSNKVIAMDNGTIVESGPTDKVLENPKTQVVKDLLGEGQEIPKANHKIPHLYRDEEEARRIYDRMNRSFNKKNNK